MKKSSPTIWHSKTYMRFMLSFCLVLVLITLVFSYFLRSILFDSAEHDMIVSSQASVNQSAIHVDQLLTTMKSNQLGTRPACLHNC